MTSTNLMPRDRLARKRRQGRLRVWIACCAAYGVVLGAACMVSHAAWGGAPGQVADELGAIRQEVKKASGSVIKARRELAEAHTVLRAGRAVGNQPDWSVLLGLLSRELGDDVVLAECKVGPVTKDRSEPAKRAAGLGAAGLEAPLGEMRYKVVLTGFGRTQSAVSQFVLRLEQVEILEQVKLAKSSRQSFGDGEAVAFRIECML